MKFTFHYPRHVFVTLGLACAFVPAVWAPARGADGGGTRSVFSEGASLRALGMGGAFTAVGGNVSALDWNPAGLASTPRTQFAFGRTSYFGESIQESHLASVVPSWRWGTLAVGVRHFGVDGIEARDERNQVLDDDLTSNQLQGTLAYARSLGESWSVGSTLKVRREQLGQLSANAVGVDLGVHFRPAAAFSWDSDWVQGLTVGASLGNFVEPKMTLDEDSVTDPSSVRLGLALERNGFGGGHFIAALDIETSNTEDGRIRSGVEWTLHPMLSLRSGVGTTGPSWGAGLHWQDFDVDYAFEDRGLGSVHRAGLSYQFGATTEERQLSYLSKQEERLQTRLEEAFEQRQEQRILNLVEEARTAHTAGDFEDALSVIEVARTLAPERADAIEVEADIRYSEALAYEKAGRLTEARLALDKVLVLREDDDVAMKAKKRVQAESSRRAARDQGIREAFSAAMDAFGRGDWSESRDGFTQVLEASPQDEEAKAMLRRTEEAIRRDLGNRYDRVRRLIAQRRFEEAARGLAGVRRLDPASSEFEALTAELDRRKAEARAKPAPAAGTPPAEFPIAETAPAAPRMSRDELDALYRQGVAASQGGRSADAVRFFELVYEDSRSYPNVRDNLVREYLTQGMEQFAAGALDDAIELWRRAVRVDPGNAKAQGYLDRALRHRNKTKEILGADQ